MKPTKASQDKPLFSEQVTSARTTLFFTVLALLFAASAIWRWRAAAVNTLFWIFSVSSLLFLFYALNYHVLRITITPASLILAFGIFHWTVLMDDVGSVGVDTLTFFQRYGGAGIHFMMVRGCYRASFNFLKYPRVALELRRPYGRVREISFSTRHPEKITQLVTRLAGTASGGKKQNGIETVHQKRYDR